MLAEEINEATAEFCDPRGALRGEFGQWIDSLEGTSETWEPYAMLMAAAGQAALLHFFSDARHTSIQEPIAADGSNIQHTTLLKDTFRWYAEWLTLLHQTKFLKIAKDDKAIIRRLWVDEKDWDGLVAHIPKIDSSRINEMKELGKKLYDTPVVDLVQPLQSRPELDWIREWREEILRCLMEMQNAAARLSENHPDRDAAVRSAFMTLHPTAWLLVRLIDAEETFEDELTYWHVEEEHMRKRIFILDDKNFARLLPSRQAVRVWDEYEPEILDTLRQIQDNARRNFDFRLLRDWGRGRAFKKLDLVIDTEGKELLELSIDGVLEKFNNFGKLSFDLFGCHPIKLKDALEGSDECCPVCLDDWVDGDVRVTTHCNHQFHPACIFGAWDLPGHFGFVCPKCRGEGLRVLGRINIPLDRIAKVNDEDLYRFSEDGLAWFNSMVDLAKTWEDDPDQEYKGVEAGDWIDMPGELWTAWAKYIRRELVQQNLTDSPQELTEKRPDPTTSWPRLDPNPVNRAPPVDGVDVSLSNMSIDDDDDDDGDDDEVL